MKTTIRLIFLSVLVLSFLAGCGAQVPVATPTAAATQTDPTPTATNTPEPTATATSAPTVTPTPTATPDVKATAWAATQAVRSATEQANKTATAVAAAATQQAIDAVWAQLVADGSVTYKPGKTYEADDFEESWAQRGWYQWWSFDNNLSDFVIMTHVDWEIPANSTFGQGGCGFAVRIKDNDNHLVTFLSPRGYPELAAMTYNGFSYQSYHWQNPENPNFRTISPALTGSSDFVVVAEKEYVTAYVDGKKIYQWYVALTSPGDMGYTIVSGTNKEFGINCKFTNTQITELIKQ